MSITTTTTTTNRFHSCTNRCHRHHHLAPHPIVNAKASRLLFHIHCSGSKPKCGFRHQPTQKDTKNVNRPISGRTSQQSLTSDQSSRKLASLSFKVENFVSSVGDALSGTFESHQILLGGPSMHLGLDDSQISKSEGNCDSDHMPPDYDTIVKTLSTHQGLVQFRLPAIALLVTNALMLTTPFEALAESCEADNAVFNMPLLLFVALIGATVGGLLARQRRGELKRLNEQLRQINAALRRQAKIESYAPSLSYAPVGTRILENEVIIDPRKHELISRLKAGKNFLRNQDPEKAFLEFKTALELAQSLKDPTEEKKAARGLGAALQRQGKYWDAIKYHSMVLEISGREGEDSGNTEAYGAIADCYTELGDLERAGKFYDKYIARLETD